MKYVYIAGPYTNPDPVINTSNAIKAADMLMALGYVPFVPHLTLFWHLLIPHDIEFWYAYDLGWLAKCDCLLRLLGESAGADNEVYRMKAWGKPVYCSIDDLIAGEL